MTVTKKEITSAIKRLGLQPNFLCPAMYQSALTIYQIRKELHDIPSLDEFIILCFCVGTTCRYFNIVDFDDQSWLKLIRLGVFQ